MKNRKLLYSGLAIFLVSTIAGIGGTMWSIYGSFEALEKAENAGIGPVGAGIERALVFTILGLIGSAFGIGIMIFAGVKLRQK